MGHLDTKKQLESVRIMRQIEVIYFYVPGDFRVDSMLRRILYKFSKNTDDFTRRT